MKTVVTGGTGFIGSHAVRNLLERGHEVHILGRREPSSSPLVRFHRFDLLTDGSPRALLSRIGAERLLHIAWFAEPGLFWHSPINEQWLEVSERLFEDFFAAGGARIVGAGSCAEYAWADGPLLETSPADPSTPYGRAKLRAAEALRSFAEAPGRDWAWGRIFHLFGPGEPSGKLVSSLIQALLSGRYAECTSGEQLRDFLHVADVGGALAALLDSEVSGIVNIASGTPITVGSLARKVALATGRPELLRIGSLPGRPNDPDEISADTRRLREEVGWRPSMDLDAAIHDTVQHAERRVSE